MSIIRTMKIVILVLAQSLLPAVSLGDVQRIGIDSREDVLGGRIFGAVGAYEKLTGRV